jgi:hypothetical protein
VAGLVALLVSSFLKGFQDLQDSQANPASPVNPVKELWMHGAVGVDAAMTISIIVSGGLRRHVTRVPETL